MFTTILIFIGSFFIGIYVFIVGFVAPFSIPQNAYQGIENAFAQFQYYSGILNVPVFLNVVSILIAFELVLGIALLIWFFIHFIAGFLKR